MFEVPLTRGSKKVQQSSFEKPEVRMTERCGASKIALDDSPRTLTSTRESVMGAKCRMTPDSGAISAETYCRPCTRALNDPPMTFPCEKGHAGSITLSI